MALVKIRTPVVVFFDGAYRNIGTEIELEEVEARRLQELHGTVDEEISTSAADRASVDLLNKFHVMYSVDNG